MNLIFKANNWWKGKWELQHQDKIFASLTMKNLLYSLAEIVIDNKRWEIGYTGWMGNQLFLRNESNNTAKAIPRSRWSFDVDIEIEKKRYTLMRDWWQTRFYALDQNGMEVVSMKPRWWKGEAEISTIYPPEDKTALLLANILFYQYKITQTHSAVVV